MPVADTSFLVDLMRRKSPAVDLYTSYEVQGIALSTTIITTLELYKGAHLSVQTEINLKKVKAILSLFDVYLTFYHSMKMFVKYLEPSPPYYKRKANL